MGPLNSDLAVAWSPPVLQGASSVDLVVLDLFNSGQLLEQLVNNSSYSELNSKLQCNPFYKALLENLIK